MTLNNQLASTRRWYHDHRDIVLITLGAGAITFISLLFVDATSMVVFYQEELRRAFFTTFLTLAGFLLSLNTFIIVKMKELVFDSEFYMNYRLDLEEVAPNSIKNKEHLGPLRRLSELLFAAIFFCFISSVLQMTIGLHHGKMSSIVCVVIPTMAIVLLVVSLIETRGNLKTMFIMCEKEAEERRSKALLDRSAKKGAKSEKQQAGPGGDSST